MLASLLSCSSCQRGRNISCLDVISGLVFPAGTGFSLSFSESCKMWLSPLSHTLVTSYLSVHPYQQTPWHRILCSPCVAKTSAGSYLSGRHAPGHAAFGNPCLILLELFLLPGWLPGDFHPWENCFFSHANKYCNVRKSLSYKISSTTWILISHCAMLWAYPCTVLNIGAVWKHLYLHGWKNSLKMWSVFLKDVQVRESILQIPQPCFEVNIWSPSVAHKAPEFWGGCCKVSNSPALAARDEGSQPLCCLCVSVFQHSEHRQVLN